MTTDREIESLVRPAVRRITVDRERERGDASLSFGKLRLRLPKWALIIGVILALSVPMAIAAAVAYEIACLKYMGHPGNIKGVIEYQRHNHIGDANKMVRTNTTEARP